MNVKVRYKKIFHTWHPDFVQDDSEPRGYRILSTGRWVVEYDVIAALSIFPDGKRHYTKSFQLEEQALAYERILHSRIDDDGIVLIDKSEL